MRPVRHRRAGGAIGGLWWLRNLNVYGSVQPAGLTPAQANHGVAAAACRLEGARRDLRAPRARPHDHRRLGSAWASRCHRACPAAITFVASVLAAALMLLAFVATIAGRRPGVEDGPARRRPPRCPPSNSLVLLLPTVLVVVPLLFHGWSDYSAHRATDRHPGPLSLPGLRRAGRHRGGRRRPGHRDLLPPT